MDEHSPSAGSPAPLAGQRDQPGRSARFGLSDSAPAGWTLDRLTLRLTKSRREALAEIADAEGSPLPPAEAIDRAIALACLFVRTSQPAHGMADSTMEAIGNGRQSSNSAADIADTVGMADASGRNFAGVSQRFKAAADIAEPALEHVRHLPNGMADMGLSGSVDGRQAANPVADMAESGLDHGRHPPDEVADMPAGLVHQDRTIGPPLADYQSPTLADWLAARLAEQGLSAVTNAVVQVKPASTTNPGSPGWIDCRLVATDGRRLIEGDVADWTSWGVSDAARLPADLGDIARLALGDSASQHALWAERTAAGGWFVFVHAFGSGGFGPAVAAFPMADTGRRPCLPVSAGTADS